MVVVVWSAVEVRPPRGLQVVEDGRSRTGPKGVLDDYREAQRNLRSQRMREALQRERSILHFSEGGNSREALLRLAAEQQPQPPLSQQEDDDGEDEEDEGDEEDDEAFAEYRAQRMAALHNSLSDAHTQLTQPLPSPSSPPSPLG